MVEETYDFTQRVTGIVGIGIDEQNLKCQSSNIKLNPKRQCQKVWSLDLAFL